MIARLAILAYVTALGMARAAAFTAKLMVLRAALDFAAVLAFFVRFKR